MDECYRQLRCTWCRESEVDVNKWHFLFSINGFIGTQYMHILYSLPSLLVEIVIF